MFIVVVVWLVNGTFWQPLSASMGIFQVVQNCNHTCFYFNSFYNLSFSVSVCLGEHNLTSNPDCEWTDCAEPFIEVAVEKSIVHEEYEANDTNYRHDIALIRLNKTVVFNG